MVADALAYRAKRAPDFRAPARRRLSELLTSRQAAATGGNCTSRLHERAAVLRGVLHAQRDREGRNRHPPHGRQHSPLHRDGCLRAQGELRQRRPARLLHGLNHCDALALFGHNVGETQAVLWMRMLDRLQGPDRPRLVVVDPRETPAAREADVHLAVRSGTNQALMNGLLRELIERGWIDLDYVEEHALGFQELAATVEPYSPDRVAEICHVAADRVRAAAEIWGPANGWCRPSCRGSTSRSGRRWRAAR